MLTLHATRSKTTVTIYATKKNTRGLNLNKTRNVVVVVVYPTPSEGWGHGGTPWSPRSRATPQGLDKRSYRDRVSPKSERRKESVAGQCRMR